MAYYGDVSLISAWCELRQDFRSFPVDRILSSQLLDEHFSPEQGGLTAAWHALSKKAPGGPSAGSKVAKGARLWENVYEPSKRRTVFFIGFFR